MIFQTCREEKSLVWHMSLISTFLTGMWIHTGTSYHIIQILWHGSLTICCNSLVKAKQAWTFAYSFKGKHGVVHRNAENLMLLCWQTIKMSKQTNNNNNIKNSKTKLTTGTKPAMGGCSQPAVLTLEPVQYDGIKFCSCCVTFKNKCHHQFKTDTFRQPEGLHKVI